MTKVTSTKSIHFPSLGWGINAGETRELPEGKEVQAEILAHPAIKEVRGGKHTGPEAADLPSEESST